MITLGTLILSDTVRPRSGRNFLQLEFRKSSIFLGEGNHATDSQKIMVLFMGCQKYALIPKENYFMFQIVTNFKSRRAKLIPKSHF